MATASTSSRCASVAEAKRVAQQVFQDADKNKNGFLSKSEIRKYFKKNPAEKHRILGSDFKWNEYFTDMDKNGDNQFDVDEFTNFIVGEAEKVADAKRAAEAAEADAKSAAEAAEADAKRAAEAAEAAEADAKSAAEAAEAAATARQVFQDADKNKNGFLTKSEIRKYFKKHPAEKHRILGSDFDWKDFFTNMDKNGDNQFDEKEFTDFVTRSSKLAGNVTVADDTGTTNAAEAEKAPEHKLLSAAKAAGFDVNSIHFALGFFAGESSAKKPGNFKDIVVSSSKDTMGRLAALDGASVIRDSIKKRGFANVIVATGMSQFEMLSHLVQVDLDWGKVNFFHLDEYIGITTEHPASFGRYLKERLVDKIPCAPKSFHYVQPAGDAEAECERLNAIIKQHPIDVAFVGIGENGHLAFNDPPADFATTAPYIVVNLDEDCRKQQLGEGWFPNLAAVPKQAISMSIKHIMASAAIVCTVPDKRKALAVKKTVEGPVTNLVPATIMQQHARCTLYLDTPSASLLK